MTDLEKRHFVKKCYNEVVEDICVTQYSDIENPTSPHTSEIIRDFKAEAAEYGYMDEEEFDKLYQECEAAGMKNAMAYC